MPMKEGAGEGGSGQGPKGGTRLDRLLKLLEGTWIDTVDKLQCMYYVAYVAADLVFDGYWLLMEIFLDYLS